MKHAFITATCCLAALLNSVAAAEPPSAPELALTASPGQIQKFTISAGNTALNDGVLWLKVTGALPGDMQLVALSETGTPVIEAVWVNGSQLTPDRVLHTLNREPGTPYDHIITELSEKSQESIIRINFNTPPTGEVHLRLLTAAPGKTFSEISSDLLERMQSHIASHSYVKGCFSGVGLLILAFIIGCVLRKRQKEQLSQLCCTLTCQSQQVELTADKLSPGNSFLIGRESQCDWQLCDSSISRNHAKITLIDNQFHYTDLSSANGTDLNNSELPANTPIPLRDGDSLQLGRLCIQINIHEKTADENICKKN